MNYAVGAAPNEVSLRVEETRWSQTKRIAFRFVFSYLTLWWLDCSSIFLFFLSHALGSRSNFFFMDYVWKGVTAWVGRHVFHIQRSLSGGSDSTQAYLQVFCELVLALGACLVWSALDRKRLDYRRLHRWLTVAVSLLLAGVMFSYGFDKVIPIQFGKLVPSMLAMQFGEMARQDVLWNFMAVSSGYTIFGGAVELLGGLLLLIPRLEAIGGMVCFAVLCNIFALNVAYDVSVKILSFQLLLMALFVLAPAVPTLTRLFVLQRAVVAPVQPSLSDRPLINQGVPILCGVLGIFFCVSFWHSNWQYYVKRETAAKPPYFGVWVVDEFATAGDPKKSVFTELAKRRLRLGPGEDQWKRVAFETPKELKIQCVNGSEEDAHLELSAHNGTAALTDQYLDPAWRGDLQIGTPGADAMTIKGKINGVEMSASLHRLPVAKFRLANWQFHWTTD